MIGTGAIKYRDDGRIVVSTHWDNSVRIFKSKKMKPLAVLRYILRHLSLQLCNLYLSFHVNYSYRYHKGSVYCVDFAPPSTVGGIGSGIFATGSKDTTIALWSVYAASDK